MIKKATIILMAIFVVFLSYSLIAQEEKKTEPQAPTQEQAAPAAEEQQQQTAPAEQQTAPAEQQQAPATGTGTKVEKHWSKNVYPEELPADAKIHIIEKGDTLWDLSGKYLQNSFLWPQIWEANKYITDAHWIYPGDPLIVPTPAQVPGEQVAEGVTAPGEGTEAEAEEQAAAEEEVSGEPEWMLSARKPKPLVSRGDILCSMYILNNFAQYKYRIVAAEQQAYAIDYSTNDIVYIDGGQAEGFTPGNKFLILHPDIPVTDPITAKPVGTLVRKTGILTVIATQEHTSTAMIIQSCFPSEVGDYLLPFEEPKVPLITKIPEIERYAPITSKLRGRVLFAEGDAIGSDQIVFIDRGSKDGVEVGSRFLIYKKYKKGFEEEKIRPDLPDVILGQLIVFETQDNISVAKVITSFDVIMLGDLIALI